MKEVIDMAEKKKSCGCGCEILPKQNNQKPVKEEKDAKKSK